MKLMVQTPSNRAAESKRQRHARHAYADGEFPVADEVPQVDFQADEEEEQHEAEICDEGEIGDGGGGEDGVGEAWDATHYGGAEQDAADDFGDDAGLAEEGEGVVEYTTEDEDDGCWMGVSWDYRLVSWYVSSRYVATNLG